MGRHRKIDEGLPQKMYRRGRTYYFVDERGRWINLGKDRGNAMVRYWHVADPLDRGTRIDRARFFRSAYIEQQYRAVKARAKQRSIAFTLTAAEFADMFERSEGRCAITGVTFSSARINGNRKRPWAPSVDRIDPSRGYEAGNCRVVCVAVNIALADFGPEVLTRIAVGVLRNIGTSIEARTPPS